MNHYVCETCGIQYNSSVEAPQRCNICDEERQYVNPLGQSWTTLNAMLENKSFTNSIIKEEDNIQSVTTKPEFAIGQSAYLIESKGFNLLWDSITYIDQETIRKIKDMGGIHAIALSHPHYYSAQVEWAEAFKAPIYIHEDDKEWVMRPSKYIKFWSGERLNLQDGLTIYRLGGHFRGGSVCNWEHGNKGKGVLLTGDVIQVLASLQSVSFMYSYPNYIPLPASKVIEIGKKVNDLKFDRIYGAFNRIIKDNGHAIVQKAVKRYVEALEGKLFNT